MELLNSLVGQINDILWSYVLIILLNILALILFLKIFYYFRKRGHNEIRKI